MIFRSVHQPKLCFLKTFQGLINYLLYFLNLSKINLANRRHNMKRGLFIILLLFLSQIAFSQGIFKEKIVAGSKNDFMEVYYYKIKGTNKEIGKKIAQIAKQRNITLMSSIDTLKNRLKYKYLKNNYPIHYRRMQGVAEEYGIDINDFSKDISMITYLPKKINCSVVFYPGNKTANNHDILSRNYDFSLGNIKLQPCVKDELPVCSRPVIFEVYPDTGYASLYITAFDLLGGVVDGINSQGLSVAVLTEGIVYEGYKLEQSYEVGLYELLIMRYLLDNCKNLQEAKEALLYLKQYYMYMPLHYIIADSQGKSFIFEFSRQRNQTFIIDNNGIQCITTHLISNHDTSNVASVKNLEKLKSMTSAKDKFTLEEIKKINIKVAPKMTYHPLYVPSRTLWHSMYDLDAKTLQVKFYLGETKNPKNKNKIITHYSKYLKFSLDE